MDLSDILAKTEWPQVTSEQAQQLMVLLDKIISPLAAIKDPKQLPDLYEHVTIGFNSTMAAVETPEKPLLAVFLTRKLLPSELCTPFLLPSAHFGFKLVQLPPSSSLDPISKGIIGVRISLGDKKIEEVLSQIQPTESNWVYKRAEVVKRTRTRLAPSKPANSSAKK